MVEEGSESVNGREGFRERDGGTVEYGSDGCRPGIELFGNELASWTHVKVVEGYDEYGSVFDAEAMTWRILEVMLALTRVAIGSDSRLKNGFLQASNVNASSFDSDITRTMHDNGNVPNLGFYVPMRYLESVQGMIFSSSSMKKTGHGLVETGDSRRHLELELRRVTRTPEALLKAST
ncbi:hypothetical protein K435DRAFT_795933 [Dendrothele bispora CBS 962.96]|uniref:Uncharacterized protein n=1 Tax=Dendrothele bispora (strain CBS 962.96) TaxID=1314807 RepID=A0A4S8M733_DENBC|nr:hypothetical protein K435DRAFT_795933 [Dendrothele bispora CBS 962.96]